MSDLENDYSNTEISIKNFLKNMEYDILSESEVTLTIEEEPDKYKLFLYNNWMYLLSVIIFIIICIQLLRKYVKKE